MCRLENLPGPIALKRMMAAMVELFCDSFAQVPQRIVLDIDDTEDRVHGGQQLALFHAHYDSRCFLPIHIYEATTGKPVAVILQAGQDAGRRRGRPGPASCRESHSRPLAQGRDPGARRQPLRPARSHDLVRAQPRRLRLRPRRQPGPADQDRRSRRGCRREPRPGRGRERASLRRVRLCRQDLAGRAAGHRAHRGLAPGQRQSLHRHQPRRRAALALRERLLRRAARPRI